MTRGVLSGGRGLTELALPDAGPQQRRGLERAGHHQYELHLEGELLYFSPELTLRAARGRVTAPWW